MGVDIGSESGDNIALVHHDPFDRDDRETQDNARLIAAAPSLYAAAKTAFDFLDNYEPGALGWTDTIEELRAALSKARGEG